ncbi:MAG TPA: non-homologous end-joining DNA ligase [Polyangia bacterium]|jgi:bifunctional non-homologous end joining protein LigD
MSLGDYNRKRNFDVTAEPPGRVGSTETGHSFVIQKHAARRLHYDFRLELDGALKSWSVPKGPSFDPAAKRLAVAVEDHPIDYGGFEGIIPQGQYGGGTVLLWDRGTWKPVGDPAAGLAAGHLKFDLFGEKLQGRWALIRLKGRPNRRGRGDDGDRNWLLVKDRDPHARPESEWDVTTARPESVASGRDLPAIAAASDRVWHSKTRLSAAAGIPQARAQAMPGTSKLVRAKRARVVPKGDDWLHEIELAGRRVTVRASSGTVRLFDGVGREVTDELAALAQAAKSLPLHDAIVDAIATALGPDGHTRADLPPTVLYVIDLPYLDGHDLTHTPLGERKKSLATLVASAGAQAGLRFADHVVGNGPETFAAACGLGASGLVSKRITGPYKDAVKNGADWRVVRCPGQPSKAAPARRPAAPRAAKGPAEVRVADVKLTHPERMLYPEAGVTKLELARYYADVAAFMLPHLEDRPLTLVRSPEGVAGKPFYVRHAGPWAPAELRQFDIKTGTGAGVTMIADDEAGLVALAQMNVLEIHAWNARVSRLELPDRMVFDLDPGPQVAWPEIVEGALKIRGILEHFELASFVKTTGSKGLHVVVPLVPHASWTDTLEFSRAIAQAIARAEPQRFSAGLAKAGREDKIFVDYLRNRRGATSVSVYSTRGRPTASVSVPVSWQALGTSTRSDAFHVTDRAGWLTRRRGDPWGDYLKTRQKLTARDLAAAAAVLRDLTKARG